MTNIAAEHVDQAVTALISALKEEGVPPFQIASALLVGAFTIAGRELDPSDWATALEKGAQILRSDFQSMEKH